MQEVMSSTPAGPTCRLLKLLSRWCCLCNYISKWIDFQVFSSRIRTINRRSHLTALVTKLITVGYIKEPTHYSESVGHRVPGVVVWHLWDRSNRLTLLQYLCLKTRMKLIKETKQISTDDLLSRDCIDSVKWPA